MINKKQNKINSMNIATAGISRDIEDVLAMLDAADLESSDAVTREALYLARECIHHTITGELGLAGVEDKCSAVLMALAMAQEYRTRNLAVLPLEVYGEAVEYKRN